MSMRPIGDHRGRRNSSTDKGGAWQSGLPHRRRPGRLVPASVVDHAMEPAASERRPRRPPLDGPHRHHRGAFRRPGSLCPFRLREAWDAGPGRAHPEPRRHRLLPLRPNPRGTPVGALIFVQAVLFASSGSGRCTASSSPPHSTPSSASMKSRRCGRPTARHTTSVSRRHPAVDPAVQAVGRGRRPGLFSRRVGF